MCFMENQVLETWQKPISHFSSSASSYFCHCEWKNKRKLCKAHFCVNTLFASHSSMKKQSACNSWNRVGGRPISPMPYSCFVFWIKLICCKLSDGINAETICMKSVVINRLEVRKFVIAKLQVSWWGSVCRDVANHWLYQGKIACANVLSDLYAMGVTDCDNMLMLIATSNKMSEKERDTIMPLIMRGFKVRHSKHF